MKLKRSSLLTLVLLFVLHLHGNVQELGVFGEDAANVRFQTADQSLRSGSLALFQQSACREPGFRYVQNSCPVVRKNVNTEDQSHSFPEEKKAALRVIRTVRSGLLLQRTDGVDMIYPFDDFW